MRSRWALLTSIALGLSIAPAVMSTAYADEKKHEGEVSLESLPKAARDTIMAQAGADKITKVEQKDEKGTTVYEAKVHKAQGGDYEIKVDSAGKLLKKD